MRVSVAGNGQWQVLLGLSDADAATTLGAWPSQTEVAAELGVTRARVGQVTITARQRWKRQPALTALRAEIPAAGLVWWPGSTADDEDGHYGPAALTTLSSDTAHDPAEAGPKVETARFERRLERSARERSFLVLTVPPRLTERAAEALTERFDVAVRSVEGLLIEAMQRVAAQEDVVWDVVLEADASPRDSDDWGLLLDLVHDYALPEVESALGSTAGTVLLTHPGLLARYDALACLERLRERSGCAFGAWVLVPTGDPTARPSLDGHALPVVGPGDWAPIPESWVEGS